MIRVQQAQNDFTTQITTSMF